MTDRVLELDRVSVGYDRGPVLTGIDLRVDAGELVGVLGPSGSGKTTLLRLLTGHARLLSGRGRLLGVDVAARRRPRVGYVPQVSEGDVDFPLTVSQVVLLGATADSARVPWFSRRERAHAAGLLERLGLAGLGDRPLAELSGGQRQRAYIARALVHDVRLLLLDEPTSGVDLQVRAEVLRLLAELHDERDLTVLLTTHDLNWVAAHLPRVVCLHGSVIADGTPREVFTPDTLQATYGTRMDVVDDRGRLFVADAAPVLGGGATWDS